MNGKSFDCMKRERDIRVETIIPSENTAFMLNPALRENLLNDVSECSAGGKLSER